MFRFHVVWLGLILMLMVVAATAQDLDSVRGRVCDAAGDPVVNASVSSSSGEIAKTDSNGWFALGVPRSDRAQIVVTAPGFAPLRFEWHRGDAPRSWRLSLPATEERITVTDKASTRTVTQITREQLVTSAAPNLDTSLRQVPGFSLFRRTPSWSANPTTQGVSLRGAGASGASRASVLLDGVPMNDPFGGWVYWGRLASDTIEEATVSGGGASDVYGTLAMGGVVELARFARPEAHVTGTAYIGNLFTPGGSVVADQNFGKWWLGGGISAFRTNGYVPVPESLRGPVDTVVNSENGSGWVRLERDVSAGLRTFLAGDLYGESRQNGTYLQFNSATIRELRTGVDWSSTEIGDVSARVYGGTENLRQTFSAITADRSSESLTRDQSVPVSQWGLSATWSKNVRARQLLLAGSDAGWIQGDDEEWVYLQGVRTGRTLSGGSQWRAAGFAQDRIRITSRMMLSAGVRIDHWINQDARTATVSLDPTVPVRRMDFADRSETFASPRLGIDYAATSHVIFHASVSRAFRAPTLNELYRGFRVGNVLTLANADLQSEKQTGADAGVTVTLRQNHSLHGTYFWSGVDDPVSNVTLTATPALITRKRQNLGSLRSTGVEFSWNARWAPWLDTTTAYQYANSIVTSFPADPTLIGLWVPQVARNNATAQVRILPANGFTIVLGGLYQGLQFDDDRNQFLLGGYFVTNLYVSKALRHNVEMFAAADNLFNRRYEVGKTPVITIGPPILARVGFRFSLGGK
jgi:outer membrane receptor protein involved in Fe transport